MKIGIMTFHKALNVGAVLQTYALWKYIYENIGDVEIIDYLPNNQCGRKKGILRGIVDIGKNVVWFFTDGDRIVREKKFKTFRKKFHISLQTYYGDHDIFENPPRYDVLISGSDQILNVTLTGQSKAYYLGFDSGAKKVSYGSSFGRSNISDEELRFVKTEMSKFDFLSAREQSAADMIMAETQKYVELVMDPVFLLDMNQWSKIKAEKKCKSRKYIFAYLMEKSEVIITAIEMVKKKYNLPIVSVYGGGSDIKDIPGNVDTKCGPTDFLSYIEGAEMVITNSFHGTAFSLIFEKKFICIAHSSRNARLQNLMSIIGKDNLLLDKVLSEDKLENYIINKPSKKENIEDMRILSENYLKKAL